MSGNHDSILQQQQIDLDIVEMLLPHVQNKTFLDVGAKEGLFSEFLTFHKFSGMFFEPLPQYEARLQKLAKKTNCSFASYAISDADEIADLPLDANINIQNPLNYFQLLDSNVKDSNTARKTITVMCKKLNTLLDEKIIQKKIGIIKINSHGNDLQVLRGMSKLEPQIIICNYFMLNNTSPWERGNPLSIIKEAEKFGFEHYVIIKKISGYELLSLDSNAFSDDQYGSLIIIKNPIFNLAEESLNQLVGANEHELIKNFAQHVIELKNEIEIQRKYCEEHLKLIDQQNTELVYINKKLENNEKLLQLKEAEHEKDKQLLELKELNLNTKEAEKTLEKQLLRIKESEQQVANVKYKIEMDKMIFQLHEKENAIQKLKAKSHSHDLDFVRDINIHFTEIYKRFTEMQQEITRTSKEATEYLYKKYTGLQREKIIYIEPLQKKLLSLQKESWINRSRARLKSFIKPKLGELNLYPPRLIITPKRYKKIPRNEKLPSISIVTPSFNHAIFLERTIKSVLEQKYPDLEHIIQDGNSKDNTQEIIKKYEDELKYWESVKDNGQSNAINLGFRHATGEIMAYLNSDDLLLPGALNYIGQYFAKHPEVDVVYGHRVLIDELDREIGRWVLPTHDEEILSWADYIPQETLFWRRSIWEKVGGKIDESFRFAMDWDLILRFRDANAKFVRLPRFLGAFRVHANQKTSSQISDTGMQEMQRLRKRCHGRTVDFKEIARATRRYLSRHLIFHRLYRIGILRY